MTNAPDLTQKLLDGLDRFSAALRVDVRRAAETRNLNPAQEAVLRLLRGHDRTGLRVRDVATHLGVRQPTATKSVNALVRKGLVTRAPDPSDARAVILRATPEPAASEAALPPAYAAAALDDLTTTERALLLRLLIKLIRGLQERGAIPPQRLCVTCRHFRPNLHADLAAPHHCAFVDAAFGQADLRLDCVDHDPAPESAQALAWRHYDGQAA